jgi:hypothetical protein
VVKRCFLISCSLHCTPVVRTRYNLFTNFLRRSKGPPPIPVYCEA